MTGKSERVDNALYLEQGKPMRFGPEGRQGLRIGASGVPEVVDVEREGEGSLLVHDEASPSSSLAFALSQLDHPEFPVPLGVLRSVQRPTLEGEHAAQNAEARANRRSDLDDLLRGPNTWVVPGD